MWWYYTGAIAGACAAGLGWLVFSGRRRVHTSAPFVALPLLIGAIVLGCVSLIAYGDSATGINDALAHLSTFTTLLHRALHMAFGAALAAVIWLLRQVLT